MEHNLDVVVVGAGFAGLIAARELSLRGKSVVVLDARDRIGGRTWTEDRLGTTVELGGAWVHWSEPHMWSELSRYGLDIEFSAEPEVAYTLDDGAVSTWTPEEFMGLLAEANDRISELVAEYFPAPYMPRANPEVAVLEAISLDEKLREFGLDKQSDQVVRGWWGAFANAPLSEVGLTWFLHFCAAGGGIDFLSESLTATIVGGTKALAESIAADGSAAIRLDTAVARIERDHNGVAVFTENGEVFRAADVVVTVPVNSLSEITFTPELTQDKGKVVSEGLATKGVKVFALLKGPYQPFIAIGDAQSRLCAGQYDRQIDGNTLVVFFGTDASLIDLNDRDEVEAELRRWIPDVDVIAVAGHDWTDDRYSQGTWASYRPGQFLGVVENFQVSDGHLHFASGDIAPGIGGTIDGAIASGLSAARRVLDGPCQ